MDLEKINESLSPIERKVLPKISKNTNVESLLDESLDKVTALRALTYLENKKLIEQESTTKKMIILGILGVNYLKKDLPERVLLDALKKSDKIPVGEIRNRTGLNENEAKIALGTLKKKVFVEIIEGKIKLIASPDEVGKKFLEEKFLEVLPKEFTSLEPQETLAYESLMKEKKFLK
jgi:DNA-binding transcriptional regulator YhcF (GntR family)